MPYSSMQKAKKASVLSGNPQNPALQCEDKKALNWLKEEPRNLESQPQQKQKEAKEQGILDPLERKINEITEELKTLCKEDIEVAKENLKYNIPLAPKEKEKNEQEQDQSELTEKLQEREKIFLADKQKAEQPTAETEQKLAELKEKQEELKLIREIQQQQQEERNRVLEEIKKVLQESQTMEDEAVQEKKRNMQMLTEKINILEDLTGMLLTYKMTRDRTVYEKMAEVLTEAIHEKQMTDIVPEYKISRWHSSAEKERLINAAIEKINAVRFSLELERLDELQKKVLNPLVQGVGNGVKILEKATIEVEKKFRDCEKLKHPELYEEVLEQEKEKLGNIKALLAKQWMRLEEPEIKLQKKKERLNQAEQWQTVKHQKELKRAEQETQKITEQQRNLQEIVRLIKQYQKTGKREVYQKQTAPLIEKLSDENLKKKLQKSEETLDTYEKKQTAGRDIERNRMDRISAVGTKSTAENEIKRTKAVGDDRTTGNSEQKRAEYAKKNVGSTDARKNGEENPEANESDRRKGGRAKEKAGKTGNRHFIL